MSTKLEFHLYPKGRSAAEPNLMPSVKDSDGATVLFTSEKRKTTEATVVNLGDSPNSNNGDPLRTAFAKINNFIEASYWTNESINKKFIEYDSEFREGIFIYTDSDERVNLSLLDNSKLYFRGTPNQIEMNITHSNSSNNPHDFDSEISLNFQLTEQVDISTLRVLEHATFDSDVDIKGKLVVDSDVILSADLRVDSDVIIKGTLSVGQEANFSDDVRFFDNAQFDSDIQVAGKVRVDVIQGEATDNVLIDDHFQVKGGAVFDSDVLVSKKLTVSKESYFIDDVRFYDNAQFDSDIVVNGTVKTDTIKGQSADTVRVDDKLVVTNDTTLNGGLTVLQEANFNDDVFFLDNAYFDSDVVIAGNLTVNGTTTHINSTNLEVTDNLIVLNYGQASPANDTGIIFTRYDSDSVSSANFNVALVWDELTDQFIFAQTQSSGILPNPTLTQQYFHVGQKVEFFDSDNDARMVWDKSHARLSILNKDGTEAFAFDADSGQMEGNGTIDAGFF